MIRNNQLIVYTIMVVGITILIQSFAINPISHSNVRELLEDSLKVYNERLGKLGNNQELLNTLHEHIEKSKGLDTRLENVKKELERIQNAPIPNYPEDLVWRVDKLNELLGERAGVVSN